MLTPAQLGVEAVADPVLFPAEGAPRRMYMFFAARPCGGGRWGIAAAQSEDGGLSWRPQGFVLQEPHFDLRNPTVFGHNEHVSWAGVA